MECEYCKKIFKSSLNMLKHQKTALYCIQIQSKLKINKQNNNAQCNKCGKTYSRIWTLNRHINICKATNVNVNVNINIKCTYCNIIYTSVDLFDKHMDICPIYNRYVKEELKKYQISDEMKSKQIIKLEAKLDEILNKAINKPTIVNNNNNIRNTKINNFNMLSPLTEIDINDNIKFLTMEHIKRGVDGYADYMLTYPLKDKLICLDYSRKKICYKNIEGEKIEDPELSKLAPKIFNAINERNSELILDYIDSLKADMDIVYLTTIDHDSYSKESVKLNDDIEYINVLLSKYLNIKSNIRAISEGENNEFKKDFVRVICNKITN